MSKNNGVCKSSVADIVVRIMFIFLVIVLIFNFSRKLTSGADLSFNAFLNWLGGVKGFGSTKVVSAWEISGNWGIIDGLRRFFNMFGNLFGVCIYLCSNLIGLLVFATQFLVFLFV